MTLKEMLKTTTIDSVLDELLISYPECIADKHHYKGVLEFIDQTPTTVIDDFIIMVTLIDPSEEEAYEEDIDEEAYLSIAGYSEKENLHFALGFSRWEEWANAKLIIQEDLEIKKEELLAMCLYEMTFYGFNQDEIANELKDLEKGIMMH
jgi:hypothetical protein